MPLRGPGRGTPLSLRLRLVKSPGRPGRVTPARRAESLVASKSGSSPSQVQVQLTLWITHPQGRRRADSEDDRTQPEDRTVAHARPGSASYYEEGMCPTRYSILRPKERSRYTITGRASARPAGVGGPGGRQPFEPSLEAAAAGSGLRHRSRCALLQVRQRTQARRTPRLQPVLEERKHLLQQRLESLPVGGRRRHSLRMSWARYCYLVGHVTFILRRTCASKAMLLPSAGGDFRLCARVNVRACASLLARPCRLERRTKFQSYCRPILNTPHARTRKDARARTYAHTHTHTHSGRCKARTV
jgi:hypothetical protein